MVNLSVLMTACMVGPNFHSPPPPPVNSYTETPLPKKTVSIKGPSISNKAQVFKWGQDIPKQWWELFHSPTINKLVCMGIANSPTLVAAYQSLQKAKEIWKAQIGSTLLPSINTQNLKERQLYAETAYAAAQSDNTFNIYYSGFNMSYTVDVFGGLRREIESLKAQVDYQQYELYAAYLSLTSNIVTTAINIASYQEQIRATQQLIHAQSNVLNILSKQYKLGGKSEVEVLIQQTLLDQTKGTMPPLEKSLALSKHLLSTLIGAFPSTPLPTIDFNTLNLPGELPVSLPFNLVRQRPDILASEALLHSASANIGVATANLFPTFIISGSYGWTNTLSNNLYTNANRIWNYMAQGTQPIFQGGSLFAKRRAAIDAYKKATAQYKQTLLQAFQNVADALRSLEIDARSLQDQKRAEYSAKQSLQLVESRYNLGAVNYVELLDAQKQYEQTLITLIQAKATRYTDTVGLFQALGGGWWNKDMQNDIPTT